MRLEQELEEILQVILVMLRLILSSKENNYD